MKPSIRAKPLLEVSIPLNLKRHFPDEAANTGWKTPPTPNTTIFKATSTSYGSFARSFSAEKGLEPVFRSLEILPKGYAGDFPGYLEFVLPYHKLRQIFDYPDAHRTWHVMLRGAAGVYLITTDSGMQYVGAAYGKEGILGRWKAYACSGHGGNKLLKHLLAKQPGCQQGFNFSILRTLPIATPEQEVIDAERILKLQLGSRAHGLNSN